MENQKKNEYNNKRNIIWMSEYDMMSLTDQTACVLRETRRQKKKELGRKLNNSENRELFNNVMIQITNQYYNLNGKLKEVKIALWIRLNERKNRKWEIRKTSWEQKEKTAKEIIDILKTEKPKSTFSKEQIKRMKMDSLNVIRARHGDPKD